MSVSHGKSKQPPADTTPGPLSPPMGLPPHAATDGSAGEESPLARAGSYPGPGAQDALHSELLQCGGDLEGPGTVHQVVLEHGGGLETLGIVHRAMPQNDGGLEEVLLAALGAPQQADQHFPETDTFPQTQRFSDTEPFPETVHFPETLNFSKTQHGPWTRHHGTVRKQHRSVGHHLAELEYPTWDSNLENHLPLDKGPLVPSSVAAASQASRAVPSLHPAGTHADVEQEIHDLMEVILHRESSMGSETAASTHAAQAAHAAHAAQAAHAAHVAHASAAGGAAAGGAAAGDGDPITGARYHGSPIEPLFTDPWQQSPQNTAVAALALPGSRGGRPREGPGSRAVGGTELKAPGRLSQMPVPGLQRELSQGEGLLTPVGEAPAPGPPLRRQRALVEETTNEHLPAVMGLYRSLKGDSWLHGAGPVTSLSHLENCTPPPLHQSTEASNHVGGAPSAPSGGNSMIRDGDSISRSQRQGAMGPALAGHRANPLTQGQGGGLQAPAPDFRVWDAAAHRSPRPASKSPSESRGELLKGFPLTSAAGNASLVPSVSSSSSLQHISSAPAKLAPAVSGLPRQGLLRVPSLRLVSCGKVVSERSEVSEQQPSKGDCASASTRRLVPMSRSFQEMMAADADGYDVEQVLLEHKEHKRTREMMSAVSDWTAPGQCGSGIHRLDDESSWQNHRVASERQRRQRIRDGMRLLRDTVGAGGDNASVLQQAVAHIQQLEDELKTLREKRRTK